jgi:hypothetical protein
MPIRPFLLFLLAFGLAFCGDPAERAEETTQAAPEPTVEPGPIPLVSSIGRAHLVKDFHRKAAIAFDLELHFGGQKRLDVRITSRTNSTAMRLDREEVNITVVYDGEGVYKYPAGGVEYPGARFDLFTWQYFALAPFKFEDPGTQWEAMGGATLGGESYRTARLTFHSGTGDAPGDWYIAYQDKESEQLHALAYIVTYGGTSVSDAEREPHAIVYEQYEQIEGIPIATEWTFWLWSAEEGLGEQLGRASLRNISFVEPPPGFFEPEQGAVPVALPGDRKKPDRSGSGQAQ